MSSESSETANKDDEELPRETEDVRNDVESHAPPPKRPIHRALVQDFGPLWFTWCMNSGILAILLHELPYQFRGVHIISTIFFLVDVISFILFSFVFVARLCWFRAQAFREITGDMTTLTLLACWPIAYITIPPLIATIVSQAPWGGYNWTLLAYVLWWMGCAWQVGMLLFVFITLIRNHPAWNNRLSSTVIIPAVGVSTLAATGAFMTLHAFDMAARMAVPVIVVSFMVNGIGLILAILLYGYLFQQLLTQSWPLPQQTTSMFLFIGPMGQCAAALQMLGASATMYFSSYNRGTFLTAEAALPLETACILISLLLNGMGFIWLFLSLYAMAERAFQRKLKWNPGWNAVIFPTGTLTSSTSQFAVEMDSPAWRVVTCILVVFMVIAYLFNLFMTVKAVAKGELMIVRQDPRVKGQQEAREKEK